MKEGDSKVGHGDWVDKQSYLPQISFNHTSSETALLRKSHI